jgi:hypothetical protein
VALGAGGAYLGHELSNGDPLATAAGAAGGVVVSETLHYAAKKQAEKACAAGSQIAACRTIYPCRSHALKTSKATVIALGQPA